nr:hypothetical protein [uncultured Trichococcus sp.]
MENEQPNNTGLIVFLGCFSFMEIAMMTGTAAWSVEGKKSFERCKGSMMILEAFYWYNELSE